MSLYATLCGFVGQVRTGEDDLTFQNGLRDWVTAIDEDPMFRLALKECMALIAKQLENPPVVQEAPAKS